MSEALSSSEIEDVLSSIRRLVSDDMRPVVKGASSGPDGEKLLLTPALRVVQSDSYPPAANAPAIDEVVLAVSAGVAQQEDEWESEIGDIAPMAELSDELAEDAPSQDWEDHQIDAYSETVPQPAVVQDILVEAVEEADVTGTGQILSFAEAASAAALPGWAQSSGAEEAEEVQPDLRPDAWVGGTLEPDRAWADQAEAAVLQELASAGPLPQMGADEFVLIEAEAAEVPVDEAMLREIVRDVLREELQGRLGERITRNIRKLVRAEIARVMASEEFL